jgi:hypothetical protein
MIDSGKKKRQDKDLLMKFQQPMLQDYLNQKPFRNLILIQFGWLRTLQFFTLQYLL